MPKQDFKGKSILITSGGTREPLDPVRFITNASSGKMGLSLAEAVYARGGKVIFVTAGAGQNFRNLPFKVIPVETARQMFKEVKLHFSSADIIIMAAAVADFRPLNNRPDKIKKEDKKELSLKLVRNPDILSWLGRKKGKRILVGFCAETEDVETQAKKKLARKKADLMVGVDLRQKGGVLGKDFARVLLVGKDGEISSVPRKTKKVIARLILDKISTLQK